MYVKLGLTALKVAAVAGRLSGIPVPNVGEFLESQLGALEQLKFDAIVEVRASQNPSLTVSRWPSGHGHRVAPPLRDEPHRLSHRQLSSMTKDPSAAAELLGAVDDKCQAMLSGVAQQAVPTGDAAFAQRLNAPLEKSVRELDELLPADWRERSGLQMETAKDGTTEWVLPHDAEEFKLKGQALLGKRSEAVTTAEDAGVNLTTGPARPPAPAGAARLPPGGLSALDEDEAGETQPLIAASPSGGAHSRTSPEGAEHVTVAQLAQQVRSLHEVVLKQQQQQAAAAGCLLPWVCAGMKTRMMHAVLNCPWDAPGPRA
jgi:hypothetical protein